MCPRSTGSERRPSTKRQYDNRRRTAQAQQTRDAILQALAEQLVSNNSPDFSVADAAAKAGVTPRTVFRYFPTKSDMLQAVSEWVFGLTGRVALPEQPGDLPQTVVDSYALFERHAELMQALLLSDLGRGVRSQMTARRRQGLVKALAPALMPLKPEWQSALTAVLAHLVTAEAWWQMRSAFDPQRDQLGQAAAWVIDCVLAAVDRGELPDPLTPTVSGESPARA